MTFKEKTTIYYFDTNSSKHIAKLLHPSNIPGQDSQFFNTCPVYRPKLAPLTVSTGISKKPVSKASDVPVPIALQTPPPRLPQDTSHFMIKPSNQSQEVVLGGKTLHSPGNDLFDDLDSHELLELSEAKKKAENEARKRSLPEAKPFETKEPVTSLKSVLIPLLISNTAAICQIIQGSIKSPTLEVVTEKTREQDDLSVPTSSTLQTADNTHSVTAKDLPEIGMPDTPGATTSLAMPLPLKPPPLPPSYPPAAEPVPSVDKGLFSYVTQLADRSINHSNALKSMADSQNPESNNSNSPLNYPYANLHVDNKLWSYNPSQELIIPIFPKTDDEDKSGASDMDLCSTPERCSPPKIFKNGSGSNHSFHSPEFKPFSLMDEPNPKKDIPTGVSPPSTVPDLSPASMTASISPVLTSFECSTTPKIGAILTHAVGHESPTLDSARQIIATDPVYTTSTNPVWPSQQHWPIREPDNKDMPVSSPSSPRNEIKPSGKIAQLTAPVNKLGTASLSAITLVKLQKKPSTATGPKEKLNRSCDAAAATDVPKTDILFPNTVPSQMKSRTGFSSVVQNTGNTHTILESALLTLNDTKVADKSLDPSLAFKSPVRMVSSATNEQDAHIPLPVPKTEIIRAKNSTNVNSSTNTFSASTVSGALISPAATLSAVPLPSDSIRWNRMSPPNTSPQTLDTVKAVNSLAIKSLLPSSLVLSPIRAKATNRTVSTAAQPSITIPISEGKMSVNVTQQSATPHNPLNATNNFVMDLNWKSKGRKLPKSLLIAGSVDSEGEIQKPDAPSVSTLVDIRKRAISPNVAEEISDQKRSNAYSPSMPCPLSDESRSTSPHDYRYI